MILYLDTSSLVKLYVDERYSADVKKWVDDAEIVATCRVAFPEAISALTRRYRAGDMAVQAYTSVVKDFTSEWEAYAVIDFDERDAGRLVEKHGLRGFDAIHLSSARLLRSQIKGAPVLFSSFDEALNRSAAAERLTVLLPD